MIVTAYKTPPVVPGIKLIDVLDNNLPQLDEESIVVVTSKIVSLSQGRVVPDDGKVRERDLIRQEADLWLGEATGRYGVYPTIKDGRLIANAGIDQSNAGGFFVLWPEKPFEVASQLWRHLKAKYKLRDLGILITDSHIVALRWGTRGFGLAWCGFEPLRDYIGKPDVFGRKLLMTKASVVDGLAAAAVLVMGEGNEQTPLAVIRDAQAQFASKPPSKKEIESLNIKPQDDLYAPILTAAPWRKPAKNSV